MWPRVLSQLILQLHTDNRFSLCSATYIAKALADMPCPNDFELSGTGGVWSPQIVRAINEATLESQSIEGSENALTTPIRKLIEAMTGISEDEIQAAASLLFLRTDLGRTDPRAFSHDKAEYERADNALRQLKKALKGFSAPSHKV